MNGRNQLDALSIDPSRRAGQRAKWARGWIKRARHRDDQVVDPARKIVRADFRPFAKGLGNARVPLRGAFGSHIRIPEAGEKQFVETRRAKTFAIAAAQRDSVL